MTNKVRLNLNGRETWLIWFMINYLTSNPDRFDEFNNRLQYPYSKKEMWNLNTKINDKLMGVIQYDRDEHRKEV